MKVGVIMGGVSSEKQVSLVTGEEMVANLNKSKYEVVPLKLSDKKELVEQVGNLDIALLALHGKYGEDGTIQHTAKFFDYHATYDDLATIEEVVELSDTAHERVTEAQWPIIKH